MKKTIKGILILLTMVVLGTAIQKATHAFIPNIYIAMFIFFLSFHFKWISLDDVEHITAPLLTFMGFYFIPPLVGLVEDYGKVKNYLIPILILIILTTVITYFAIGLVMSYMMRRDNE